MAIRKSRALGLAPSKMDGTEHVFSVNESLDIPDEYSYVDYMSKVIDQGQNPICVACSISAYVNWKKNMETGEKDEHFKSISQLKDFFYEAGGGPNGMTFKDALHYLRHNGIETKEGNFKIREYALADSVKALKNAIIMNGPCLGGLPVMDTKRSEFWKSNDNYYFGGHAIAIVGWTKTGFIIRNSWGKYFGNKGYVEIPYSDFILFMECWTMI